MQDSLLGDDDEQNNSLMLNTAFCNSNMTHTSQISSVINDTPAIFNQARSALHQSQQQVQLAVKNFPTEYGKRQQHRCFICGQQDHEAKDCRQATCYFCGTMGCDCTELSQMRHIYEQQCFRCGSRKHFSAVCDIPLKSVRNPFCIYCGVSGHSVRYCGIFKRVASRKMPIFTAGYAGNRQSERRYSNEGNGQNNQNNVQQWKRKEDQQNNRQKRFRERDKETAQISMRSNQMQQFFDGKRNGTYKESRNNRKK